MTRETGGPAFPQPIASCETDPSRLWSAAEKGEGGMTLRDYFAAKAMQAIIANDRLVDSHRLMVRDGLTIEQSIAIGAGMMANAMLAERSK